MWRDEDRRTSGFVVPSACLFCSLSGACAGSHHPQPCGEFTVPARKLVGVLSSPLELGCVFSCLYTLCVSIAGVCEIVWGGGGRGGLRVHACPTAAVTWVQLR